MKMRAAPALTGNTLIKLPWEFGAQLLNKRPVRPVTGATLNSAALRDFMDARGQWQVPVTWSCYTSDVQRSCHSNGTILLNLGGEHCFFSSCFGVIYDMSFFFRINMSRFFM